MLGHGIIEPSTSDWASPIVTVRKKDTSIRICVDYRRLNSYTKVDAYPMPKVDDLVDRVSGASYITTLDLTKGYAVLASASCQEGSRKDSIYNSIWAVPFP